MRKAKIQAGPLASRLASPPDAVHQIREITDTEIGKDARNARSLNADGPWQPLVAVCVRHPFQEPTGRPLGTAPGSASNRSPSLYFSSSSAHILSTAAQTNSDIVRYFVRCRVAL